MTAPIRLAHSSGGGASQFLHRSLCDALTNRTAWTDLFVRPGEMSERWVEFVFARNGLEAEVVRFQMSGSGQPDHVEVWAFPQAAQHVAPHPATEELSHWLGLTVASSVISNVEVIDGHVQMTCGLHEISLRCDVTGKGNPLTIPKLTD